MEFWYVPFRGRERGEESALMQSAAITDDPEECKTPPFLVEKDSLASQTPVIWKSSIQGLEKQYVDAILNTGVLLKSIT